MTVALVSRSVDLHKLCRSILADLGQVELITVSPNAFLPSANLFLWDYTREADLSRIRAEEADRHIVLVNRDDLAYCGASLPPGVILLLKPSERVVLSRWLCAALATSNKRDGFSAASQTNSITGRRHGWCDLLAKGLHDFGAPLTAASGYCELLLAEGFGPLSSRQSEILGRMRNSLARLGRMTSDMFEKSANLRLFSKGSSSAIAGFHPVDEHSIAPPPRLDQDQVERCVRQAIHEIELFAAGKRLRVVSRLAPTSGTTHFDPCQLEQVLSNLLDNACKFAYEGGRIEIHGYSVLSERAQESIPRTCAERSRRLASPPSVRARRVSTDGGKTACDAVVREFPESSIRAGFHSVETGCNYFRIDVFNTGPSIAPEFLDRIFDEYATFAISKNRPIGSAETGSAEIGSSGRAGAGLGLAICRRIVEQHRGKIWAENRPEGPMISFLLPLSGNELSFKFDGTQEPKGLTSIRRPYWRELGSSRPYAS